jgi:ribonuclease P protein component
VKQGGQAERIPGGKRFGRARRVRSSRDFQRVRRRGRHASATYLAIGCARRDDHGAPTRAGFSVSKRVGGAVQRNRVKRRLRSLIRLQLAALPRGYDVIITARSGAAEAAYDDLAADLRSLLTRVGLEPAEKDGGDTRTPDDRGDRGLR